MILTIILSKIRKIVIKLDFLTFQDFYLCKGMFAEKISTGVKHHIHEQTAKKSTLTPNLTNVVIGLHICTKNIF